MEAVIFLAGALAGLLPAFWERRKRQKTFRQLNQMLERVLDRQPVGVSDLKEGEISVLANQALRIQEKLEYEVGQATKEKEQVKSLVSNMSHQLKTPLSNVVMYQEMLEGPLDEQQRRIFLQKMKVQVGKMDWILRSLFRMVMLEQGAMQFEAAALPIKETLLLAVNTVYEKAEQKKIRIRMEPFTDFPLYHDRKWTAEVFGNVLENAVKYSPTESQIEICVCPMELVTQIRFTDHGIGIRREEFPQIFRRFYRSREVTEIEGSGIGLYLSRLILEQEKGYLTVESEYGTGSIFSVFLQNGGPESDLQI